MHDQTTFFIPFSHHLRIMHCSAFTDFPSTSLTFNQCMFSNHIHCCFCFYWFSFNLYVFSKAVFLSSPLTSVSTAASLQQWESITLFQRKLNTHSYYSSPECNESGSEKHLKICSRARAHTQMTVIPDFQENCTQCSAQHLCAHTSLSESGCYNGEDAVN